MSPGTRIRRRLLHTMVCGNGDGGRVAPGADNVENRGGRRVLSPKPRPIGPVSVLPCSCSPARRGDLRHLPCVKD